MFWTYLNIPRFDLKGEGGGGQVREGEKTLTGGSGCTNKPISLTRQPDCDSCYHGAAGILDCTGKRTGISLGRQHGRQNE